MKLCGADVSTPPLAVPPLSFNTRVSWAVPAIPLWACYGIIGGLLILAGGALLLRAKAKAEDIHVVPERTAETMKENLKWIKNPTS